MIDRPMLPMKPCSQCRTAKIGFVRKKYQPQSIELMKSGIVPEFS